MTLLSNPEFRKHRLENGLELILLEDHRLPLVAVNIWYHVGPVNERPGLTGFAHLFEHMMFEGSRYVGPKAHFQHLESAGATTINGTTDFDRTNYYETVPSNQLELALWLESDRMGFLPDILDDHMLEMQRDVVRNERRQNVENGPYGLVHEALYHQLFPSDHPYYASVIGSHRDIEAAKLADIREFFELYYAPNNASIAIVGDIDPEKTKALVERYFGPIPAGKKIPASTAITPPITSERRATVTDQVELPRIYLAWLTPPVLTQADAECDLLAKILGGGKSSRLYQKLVYEKRIAQDVGAHQSSLALSSIFAIEATCKPGIEPDRLEAEIREELELFRTHGPTAAELERARNTYESSFIRGLENLGVLADRLNQYNHFLKDPGGFSRDLERYGLATTEALRSLAHDSLRRDAGVVVHGVPGVKVVDDIPKSSAPTATAVTPMRTIPDQDWRSVPPAPGRPPTLSLPVPSSFQLSNGLTVFLVEQHGLPIVAANLILLCGGERNPSDRPGLASFTAEMLDEGTATRTPLQIATDCDQIGASLSTGASMDMSYMATRVLRRNVDAAFELLADVLLNPAFDPAEVERIRHDRLTRIRQQKDSPESLALRVLFDVIYGAGHPYGYTDLGSDEANRSIDRNQLVAFYRSGYIPAHSALIVAGDVTAPELLALAEKRLGAWRGDEIAAAMPDLPAHKECRIIIVDKPDAPQTALRVGHIGVARSNPDYAPLDVMNTALGGLFSSRINQNLREKHGYTYGAHSAFVFRRGPGPFLIGTSVRTDATAPAVREILHEMQRIRTGDLIPAELATAKDSLDRSLPGYFETTSDSASSIGQLFVHGLPPDYYHDLPETIRSISAAQVREAAARHLDPERAIIVAVGDRKKIEPELAQLKLAPIEIRDVDDILR